MCTARMPLLLDVRLGSHEYAVICLRSCLGAFAQIYFQPY